VDGLSGVGWSEDQVAEMLAVAEETTKELVVGASYEDDLETYAAAEIKQVVLYFEAHEYESVMSRIQAVMEREGVNTHTGAFLALLGHYEEEAGN
jgi:hypothetical protein